VNNSGDAFGLLMLRGVLVGEVLGWIEFLLRNVGNVGYGEIV
jgi:hypothetical protein